MFTCRYRVEEDYVAKSHWISWGLQSESFWHFRHDSPQLHEGCFLWKVKLQHAGVSVCRTFMYLLLVVTFLFICWWLVIQTTWSSRNRRQQPKTWLERWMETV